MHAAVRGDLYNMCIARGPFARALPVFRPRARNIHMPNKTVTWTKLADVAARVAELGFPLEVLLHTIDVWIAGMNSGTPFHAENYPGTLAYHESLATLRLEGQPFGLEKLSREGVQLCLCSATKIAVVISQGDGRTGDVDNLHIKPSTKYKRGRGSRTLFEAQPFLPGFDDAGDPTDVEPYDVWILLLRMTPTGETVAELSWPAVIDVKVNSKGEERCTILDWHERILLGTFSAGPRDTKSLPDDFAPTGDVDVPVKKRG